MFVTVEPPSTEYSAAVASGTVGTMPAPERLLERRTGAPIVRTTASATAASAPGTGGRDVREGLHWVPFMFACVDTDRGAGLRERGRAMWNPWP